MGFFTRTGVFLAQALYHANEHRAHTSARSLARWGTNRPTSRPWGYALATGRMTLKDA